jgi:ATP-dependent helicase/nuclease subunit A
MMMSSPAIDLANAQQLAASDPATSAFVAASAGSGKTKLLTDRLLRLMLRGTAPEKILCLTYTKAAAAEMTIRLNRRLGDWVVMEAAKLERELRALDVAVSAATLARARNLFADVLDLPGGMRIGTIHAFCQSLLRRFPLEANLSPHFQLSEEVQSAKRLRAAREAVLVQGGMRDAIAALAAETNEQDFATLMAELAKESWEGFGPGLAAMQAAALGAGEETEAALLAAAVKLPNEDVLRASLQHMQAHANLSGQKFAAKALAWLNEPDRAAHWQRWVAVHFTDKGRGTQNKLHNFFGKLLVGDERDIRDEIDAECRRIEAVQERLKICRAAALNARFLELAAPVLRGDAAQKEVSAELSYGDLVSRARALFEDPGAAWILYKLDGGVEHVLLDEVQDTAPAQWEIAYKIAEEFFAGAGAREVARTVFAVGDPKQSIFSFQGADLESFLTYRSKFRDKVRGAGAQFLDGELSVSFRSAAPVLALTDAVFAAGPARDGVVGDGEVLRHEVSRTGQAGRVEIWPLAAAAPAAAPDPWRVPEAYEVAESATEILARSVADFVAERLSRNLESQGRLARPGDFLILVRRRNAIVPAITRELKAHGIAVAGADRVRLTEALAVQDLLALCEALLLPENDLAFAQFLVSPLGGLSDESLMELAVGRGGRKLFAALYARAAERAEWREAQTFFEALRGQVGFVSPFALLSEALGRLGGRARLLRRLGAEAAEAVDELLAEALQFSAAGQEPASLLMFLQQLRLAGADIKREAEAGNVVRIMTVHGAKGLQAPIVILPDTVGMPEQAGKMKLFWLEVPQQPGVRVPVFCPRAEMRPGILQAAAAAREAADRAEYNRLLYVALTRAEDELIMCGAQGRRAVAAECWYESVRAGFLRLGAVADEAGKLVLACPQAAAPTVATSVVMRVAAPLPGWAGAAPDWAARGPGAETTRPERLAPSRGAENMAATAMAASPLAEGGARAARAAAMARGRAVHALLQHLPDVPVAERAAAAAAFLARIPQLRAQAPAVATHVMAVLEKTELAAVFGAGSVAEIPLAGVVGDVEIGGLVDRLVITDAEIVVADFKTDRAPPASVDAVPSGYLRQLAAYKAILAQIYPGRPVRCLLIWTQTAAVMVVPAAKMPALDPA